MTFSPLFIAAMVATYFSQMGRIGAIGFFQSAFHRGNGCYEISNLKHLRLKAFQSAFHRGNGCYTAIRYVTTGR